MRRLLTAIAMLLLVLPLLSFGPVPQLPPATIEPPPVGRIVVQPWHAPKSAAPAPLPAAPAPDRIDQHNRVAVQASCTYDNAPMRRRTAIYDDLGMGAYEYGVVSAWSCTDFDEMQSSYNQGVAEMQANITRYHDFRATCLALPEDQQYGCTWPRP